MEGQGAILIDSTGGVLYKSRGRFNPLEVKVNLYHTITGKQRSGYLALYIGIWTLPGLMAAGQAYSEAWFESRPIPVQEVPLRQELEFIQQYIDIEQIRFTDRLAVKLDAEPETLDAMVPNFILQPLVENAIRHGIAASSAEGLLEIGAARSGGRLIIRVSDSGPGLKSAKGETENGGIGLANTRARLQQLYGQAGHCDLRDADGGGAVATLTIPFRTFSDVIRSDGFHEGKNQSVDR
jgi:Histidine kinase-, DNA gyrase B-, and HSP90-like ATPase/Histidine kinase